MLDLNLGGTGSSVPQTDYDVAIIGGGPAGTTAAIYAGAPICAR